MTPEELKQKVGELIAGQPVKIWLTRTSGHRLDFIWSVGSAQLTQEETIVQGERYFLVGQEVSDELRPLLIDVFTEFVNSDDVQNAPDEDRRMRLHQA